MRVKECDIYQFYTFRYSPCISLNVKTRKLYGSTLLPMLDLNPLFSQHLQEPWNDLLHPDKQPNDLNNNGVL